MRKLRCLIALHERRFKNSRYSWPVENFQTGVKYGWEEELGPEDLFDCGWCEVVRRKAELQSVADELGVKL